MRRVLYTIVVTSPDGVEHRVRVDETGTVDGHKPIRRYLDDISPMFYRREGSMHGWSWYRIDAES